MEILFKRNVPQQKMYSYAVKDNNNSNTITFVLDKIQEDNLDLSSLTCFVKVKGYTIDKDVVVKIVEENKVKIKWVLKRKHTKSRIISVQLQFEGYENDLVWQSEIIEITLSGTIKADEYIENEFPGELMDHEARIQALEEKDHDIVVTIDPKIYENEDGLTKIIRKRVSRTGDVSDTYVIDKENTPEHYAICEYILEGNNNQVSSQEQFESSVSRFDEVFGENTVISNLTNIYTLFYNNEVGGITQCLRLGTANNVGELVFSNLEPHRQIVLNVGKYFRYNSENEKIYDNKCYLYVEDANNPGGVYIEIQNEPQEITLEANDEGQIYIDNECNDYLEEGEKAGRLLLYSFEYYEEAKTEYKAKQLAKIEDLNQLEENLQEEIEQDRESISETNSRIDNVEEDVEILDQEIEETNKKIGDVQIFEAKYNLPNPEEKWLNTIFRFQGKLYQCVKQGDLTHGTFDFADISGTTEVKESNFDSFAQDVGREFADNIFLGSNSEETHWLKSVDVNGQQYFRLYSGLFDEDTDLFNDASIVNAVYFGGIDPEGYWEDGSPDMEESIYQILINGEGNTFHLTCSTGTYIFHGKYLQVSQVAYSNATENFIACAYESAIIQKISKMFRDNGKVKYGSSSAIGSAIFETNGKSIVELKLTFEAYHNTKRSAVQCWFGDEAKSVILEGKTSGGAYRQTITFNANIDDNITSFGILGHRLYGGEYRVELVGLEFRIGSATFEWKEISGVSSSQQEIEVITFTDDDYDETDNYYVKHLTLDEGKIYSINDDTSHEHDMRIYSKQFKALNIYNNMASCGIDGFNTSFDRIEGNIDILSRSSLMFTIICGCVFILILEL